MKLRDLGWQNGYDEDKVLAVIVGRFQAPALTDGHKALINKAMAIAHHVLILVGLTSKSYTPDERNPLPFEAVQTMIQACYGTMRITVAPIFDTPDDDKWIKKVVQLAGETASALRYDNPDIRFVGGTDSSFLKTAKRMLPSVSADLYIEMPRHVGVSATNERHKVRAQPAWSSRSFREGVIWATRNPFQ